MSYIVETEIQCPWCGEYFPTTVDTSQGGYATFLEKRAELVANQRKQQDVLDNQVRREVEWLRRNPAAQTVKSKARSTK